VLADNAEILPIYLSISPKNMKTLLTAIAFIVCLSSCSIFRKRPYVPPIGAEKIFALQQPGYKPKTPYQKAEYKAMLRQLRRDRKLAKKQRG
jgi:hypothetical protein